MAYVCTGTLHHGLFSLFQLPAKAGSSSHSLNAPSLPCCGNSGCLLLRPELPYTNTELTKLNVLSALVF